MDIGAMISNFFEMILMAIFGFINQFISMDFMYNQQRVSEFVSEIYVTLQMLLVSGFFALLFGLLLGVMIMVTQKDGILENKIIYFMLDKFINFFRSVPFVILISVLMGLSRLIVGTASGVQGMYIPLIFGTIPFFARQVEASLSEIDKGLIEASIAMGDSPLQIITKVYLRESIPSIIRSISITMISLIGLTAMAGQVGGGGLGSFAIRYGYARGKVDATWATVVVILLMVSAIQALGNFLTRKTTH